MTHDPDAYDRARDDDDTERYSGKETDDRRIFLDAICGATTDYHELDPEGVMWG